MQPLASSSQTSYNSRQSHPRSASRTLKIQSKVQPRLALALTSLTSSRQLPKIYLRRTRQSRLASRGPASSLKANCLTKAALLTRQWTTRKTTRFCTSERTWVRSARSTTSGSLTMSWNSVRGTRQLNLTMQNWASRTSIWCAYATGVSSLNSAGACTKGNS